jgi:hypothetical protein
MKDPVYRRQRSNADDAISVHKRLLFGKRERRPDSVTDLAKGKLLRTRESVMAYWRTTADILDAQGEIQLAGDVRYFARRLPACGPDGERRDVHAVPHIQSTGSSAGQTHGGKRDHIDDLVR